MTPTPKPPQADEDYLGKLYSKLDKLNLQLSHSYICLGYEIYTDRDISKQCDHIRDLAGRINTVKNEIMQREYDESMDR